MVLQICYEEVGIGDITIAIDKNADLEKRIAIAAPKLEIGRKPITLELSNKPLEFNLFADISGSRCCR